MELKGVKPKIKINICEEEMALDDENLISVIMKQNRLDVEGGFYMRMIKRIVKKGRNKNKQSEKKRKMDH